MREKKCDESMTARFGAGQEESGKQPLFLILPPYLHCFQFLHCEGRPSKTGVDWLQEVMQIWYQKVWMSYIHPVRSQMFFKLF